MTLASFKPSRVGTDVTDEDNFIKRSVTANYLIKETAPDVMSGAVRTSFSTTVWRACPQRNRGNVVAGLGPTKAVRVGPVHVSCELPWCHMRAASVSVQPYVVRSC